MARKTLLLINDEPEVRVKGMAPIAQTQFRALELSTEVIHRNFRERLLDLSEMLAGLPDPIGSFSPAEITVGFAVSASGEVSLLSALKGGVGVTGTFQVKLVRASLK